MDQSVWEGLRMVMGKSWGGQWRRLLLDCSGVGWLSPLTLTSSPQFLLVAGWYLLLPWPLSLPAGGFGHQMLC